MHETIDMHGRLTLQLRDRAGRIIGQRRFENRIVTSGRRLVAEFFSGVISAAPPTAVTHMAVGTGAAEASDGNTALEAQRGNRNPITSSSVMEFDDNGVMRVRVNLQTVFSFQQANDPNVPLREAGIFNAATGGVMYNRVVFEPVTKTDAFELTLFWDIDF